MSATEPGASSGAKRSSRTEPTRRARGPLFWGLAAVIVVLVLAIAFVSTSFYTDRPQFCPTCHEMRPYYDAWAKGPHSTAWCVDCHVGKSYAARMAHKFDALGEVAAHFGGNSAFPLASAPMIAEANCTQCHATIGKSKLPKGFDHDAHALKGTCQACHADAGHPVTSDALKAAGAFNPNATPPVLATSIAKVGAGAANVPGHVSVACTRCHDMKKTTCGRCHTKPAKHKQTGACEACHQAGPKWIFTHPAQGDCGGNCHAPSPKHFKPVSASLTPCTTCHQNRGVSWAIQHPAATADCQSCHARPAKHPAGQCSVCHKRPGVSFAFKHPAISAPHGIGGRTCVQCHPSGYSTFSCTCHGGGNKGGD